MFAVPLYVVLMVSAPRGKPVVEKDATPPERFTVVEIIPDVVG